MLFLHVKKYLAEIYIIHYFSFKYFNEVFFKFEVGLTLNVTLEVASRLHPFTIALGFDLRCFQRAPPKTPVRPLSHL